MGDSLVSGGLVTCVGNCRIRLVCLGGTAGYLDNFGEDWASCDFLGFLVGTKGGLVGRVGGVLKTEVLVEVEDRWREDKDLV